MSKPAFEVPPVLAPRLNRGSGSSQGLVEAHEEWIQDEDLGTSLKRRFGEWLKDLSESEVLFKKHVYDNEDLKASDMRQHRIRICTLIAEGEKLALDLLILANETNSESLVKTFVESIDETIKKLLNEFVAWHGKLDDQPDIPESFKKAAQESESGKLEDLDI
ncbi:MAG TPA: hypothetical protein VNV43_02810 [Candidatus Acidoferrales bacterium]|jgi:hypothetical protein|nr:hypothetical protein [Candidatus Acidoferrales bacterium]